MAWLLPMFRSLWDELNGYEVCKAIKSISCLQGVPVIFLTAMSQQEDEVVGLELGAVDYITKPFNTNIVKLRAKNHLELKRFRDNHARLALLDWSNHDFPESTRIVSKIPSGIIIFLKLPAQITIFLTSTQMVYIFYGL
jgi:DNA-binding response OmpR family regulator